MKLRVLRAGAVFDAQGALVEAVLRQRLGKYLANFAAHIGCGAS